MRLEISRFLRIFKECSFGGHCFLSMLAFDAICRGRRYFWILLLFFDAWFWCYLSWPDTFLEGIAFLRCLILLLFVVAGQSWGDHCFSSMLNLDAICRGRRYFWKSLFVFDAWFWCYLWCSRALGHFIVCLRCLILMLFVVAGGTFESHWLPSMLDFDAICGVPEHLAILLFALDVCFWCYLSWPELLLEVIAFLRCLIEDGYKLTECIILEWL